ncbi:uncharacterized protein LOC135500944 [Lineus longissimus]|uniref:uncharacterized protein LOC135500944 n=1 Tax=Lineus longissimus TaxID=88925 RepID=UPI002B4C8345
MASPGERLISLGAGIPCTSVRVDAAKVVQKAVEARIKEELETGAQFLTYLSTGEGHPEWREEMSKFLSEEYGDPVSSDDLHLTAGATHGLHLAMTLLLEKGSPCFTEEPHYFLAAGAIKDSGILGVPVEMDDDGLSADDLEKKASAYEYTWDKTPSNKPYRGVVYMVPIFHNPTGKCYSPERCRALVAIARKHNLLLFSEDVYNLLYYTGNLPPKRFFFYDNKSDADYVGSVISNGSFSKYLAPGIRIGWYEAPKRAMDCFEKSALLRSGGPVNHFGSGIITSALKLGIQQDFIKKLRAKYAKRVSLFGQVLEERLPSSCSFKLPKGGYFVWIQLPNGVDGIDITKKAETEFNVMVLTGSLFSQTAGFRNCIRLSISAVEDEEIVPGLTAFCDCLTKYLPQKL